MGCLINSGFSNNDRIVRNVILVFAALSRRQESLSRLATRWGWGEVTDDISNNAGSNRAFSHDVTAAILVFQNNETAAMLVFQTNPVGVELFSFLS